MGIVAAQPQPAEKEVIGLPTCQLFHFYLVEALAEDTDDEALADKGVGVDDLDEAEDEVALALAGQQTDDLTLLACVPAVAVEDGDAVLGLCAQGIGYLLPFAAEDEELHRL